jgi:hypothetical protein
MFLVVGLFCFFLYEEPEALSYEIFMWGDVGMSTDIRFYGVAPHWYFRPYMAWLIVCPHHRPGIFGLVYFFVIIFYQPNLHGAQSTRNYRTNLNLLGSKKYSFKLNRIGVEYNLYYQTTYAMFIMCIAYSTTFLPYGRFYNRLGGNVGMLFAYLYIFTYLGFPAFKKSSLLSRFHKNVYTSVSQAA